MGFIEEEKIKAVAFDIDGTMYPLRNTHINIIRASLFHLPFAIKYNKARKELRRLGKEASLALTRDEVEKKMALLIYGSESKQGKFRDKEKRVFWDKYEKYFLSVKPRKGLEDLLILLKGKGIKLAVLSDFPIGTKLKAMGLDEYFPIQITTEDFGRYKPSSIPFKILSSSLDEKSKNILYIGDSLEKDIIGAKESGMRSALISKKQNALPDITVSSFLELKEKLF